MRGRISDAVWKAGLHTMPSTWVRACGGMNTMADLKNADKTACS